jgi:branched-chain amino acid transport system permease protein
MMARALSRGWLAALAAAVIALALPQLISAYQVSLITEMLIYALLAMAIDFMAGYTGRTSLCHGAIFGLATYVVIYFTAQMGGSPYLALLLGIAASTLLAAIFGLLAIRASGVYFLLLTLALGMIVWGVCLRWTSVTGGENGLRGLGRPEPFTSQANFYYAVLALVAVATFLIWRVVNSPFGLTLKGIKDSESRMRALGYNVPLHLFLAFVLSGLIAGAGGALYAMYNGFVSPPTVGLVQSVDGLLMAIIGGVGTLFGAFIGSAIIIGLENFISLYTERWQLVLGVIFVAIIIFAPDGVLGSIRKWMTKSKSA